MSIRWENNLDFSGLLARVEAAKPEALKAGGEVIKLDAVEKVPKDTAHLAGTADVNSAIGGDDTVGITFDGPYARYIHEHLQFKHPHGGQAKFLEAAMVEKQGEAIDAAADVLREAL